LILVDSLKFVVVDKEHNSTKNLRGHDGHFFEREKKVISSNDQMAQVASCGTLKFLARKAYKTTQIKCSEKNIIHASHSLSFFILCILQRVVIDSNFIIAIVIFNIAIAAITIVFHEHA